MGADATVQEWGNFTAYWIVPNYLELGGTYWLNVTSTATDATDEQEHYAQTSITIVPEAIEIEPNSDSYSLGEIITFTIKATFKKTGAELTIEDPDGNLIFKSTLNTWESVDNWEVVRYWDQVTDGPMNPFLIPSDASIGTWVWSIDDDDEVIANGTIEVLPTTAEQVDARLSDVEGSLADLSDDIAGVTSDLGDEIDALSSELGDVASDVDGLRDEIVGDLSDDIAAATAAANAAGDAVDDLEGALGDLEDSVGDIATTADNAKSAADAAADAASDAASAAEDASSAASGLTTLVYGAIGASLIAALAAIVSLMQISRRIAG
jgi:methyl-accepting chemotaxis protein